MKKFVLFLIKCGCVFALIYASFITSFIVLSSNKSLEHSYLASDFEKLNRLSETSSPRIVFIGGSNLAFGLHSSLIKDSLNIEPVNMGIHAGIGLNYMLKEVTPYLTEKDILVIVPEYEQFSKKVYYGEEALSDLLIMKKEWKKLILQLNWFTYPRNLFSVLISDLIHDITHKEMHETYDRTKFNKYGDYIGHWMFNHHAILSETISASLCSKVVEDIRQNIIQIKDKGITVYLFPPPRAIVKKIIF
ncbi:MAG: hypothetical protein LUH63_07290 [Parabacteroides sp.]|nr:hypothetical protein [Parabacteroides sp.]